VRADNIQVEDNVSMLLKAAVGFSKTCAASTFCLEGDIYIFYLDKKKPIELDNFYRRIVKRPELLSRIEYDTYGAHNAGKVLEKMIQFSHDCRYHAIIVDSVTNLTAAAVNWSLAFRGDTSKTKKKDSKDPIIPDWDEYKVETSLVSQCLDICRTLPTNVIWLAHPVPSVKIEGTGTSVKVSKVNPIVTYGSKVAGIVPGNFSEIYHFSKGVSYDSSGNMKTSYLVSFDAIGDDYAKSNLGLTGEIDITDRMFYEVWKEKVKALREVSNENEVVKATEQVVNPFGNVNW